MVELFEGDVYRELKQKGFDDNEIRMAMQDPNLIQNYQPANTIYSPTTNNENLVQFQLELNDILERMEHIFRGDKLTFRDGREIWVKCNDPKQRLFNDQGVAELMAELTFHINRNTILSNFKQETINDILYDIGVRLNDLIYMKYEEFGWDSSEKRKHFAMILGNFVDMCRNTYHRALEGGERLSLREARSVTQNEIINSHEATHFSSKKKSMFNPFGIFSNR